MPGGAELVGGSTRTRFGVHAADVIAMTNAQNRAALRSFEAPPEVDLRLERNVDVGGRESLIHLFSHLESSSNVLLLIS